MDTSSAPLPERFSLTSANPNAERLNQLRALFPEAFTEGKLDAERLRAAIGDDAATGRERYELTWAGKADAIRAVQSLSVGTLTPDRAESVNFDTTENMIIEGDNLEVLKLLQKGYQNRVKMIYIDPPYNTGKEFIYPDRFQEGLNDYLRYSGQVGEGGERLSANTDTSGRYHSRWLSMMYPRLFLARNLLRDDGVIFVSIDDNEVHNLRLLLNELFGEENFIAEVVWQRHAGGGNDSKYFAVDHEYVLACARNKEAVSEHLRLPLSEKEQAEYKFKDEHFDTLGPYKTKGFSSARPESPRPNLRYEIEAPDGTLIAGEWRWEKKRFLSAYKDNKTQIRKDRNGSWVVEYKIYLNIGDEDEGKTKVPRSLLTEIERNSDGKQQLRSTFGDSRVFTNPKPTGLVEHFGTMATSSTQGDVPIVLDFFAGSGSTADALLN